MEKPKRVKHYSSAQSILLVGDRDFSFSVALATAFGSGANLVATSLDSYGALTIKYRSAASNIMELKRLGALVLHGVNAKTMKLHSYLKHRQFDRVIFNFPHAGFRGREDEVRVINSHRNLVFGFFINARHLLGRYGEIHVNHDLVLFVRPFSQDFTYIRQLLESFAGASVLVSNLDKCSITPIHCSQLDVTSVLEVFPCRTQEFPTKYLGAPLTVRRLTHAQEQPFIDAVATRIPSWKGGLLTTAGRGTLVRTTLSAIPVHVSICFALSPWAIKEIDRRRRAFLWAGTETVAGGRCKVAWPIVCSPTDRGGLGLPDLAILGMALRLRWEWRRRTDPTAPCAALPGRPDRKMDAMFASSVYVIVGDGTQARFWTDSWLPDGPISRTAPTLFASVAARRRQRCVRDALTDHRWVEDVSAAHTMVLLVECAELLDKVMHITLQPGVPDRFVWKWSPSGDYSSASAYRAFFLGSTQLLGATELWRASAPPKVKFFFWLGLHGRLWTAERRARHGLQQSADCALCSQEPETADHLLAGCVFAREVWCLLLQRGGLLHLAPVASSRLVDWWLSTRAQVPQPLCKGFDSLVLLVSWELWKERNRRTFDDQAKSPLLLLQAIFDQADEWIASGFRHLSRLLVAGLAGQPAGEGPQLSSTH